MSRLLLASDLEITLWDRICSQVNEGELTLRIKEHRVLSQMWPFEYARQLPDIVLPVRRHCPTYACSSHEPTLSAPIYGTNSRCLSSPTNTNFSIPRPNRDSRGR